MARILAKPDSTSTLKRSAEQLANWKSRILDASNSSEELDAVGRTAIAPLLQELKDRCDRAENEILRLHQVESAWKESRAAVEARFSELHHAWMSVERTLQQGSSGWVSTPGGQR